MSDSITITLATSADAEQLAHIKQAIWLDTYQSDEYGITAADILAKDLLCPQRIQRRAEHMRTDDGINRMWTARDGDSVVGYIRAVKGDDVNEVVTLYVLPEWQGRRIGSALLEQALGWLGADTDVAIGVVAFNEGAIRFYERFGFRVAGTVPHDEPTFPSGRDLPEIEMVRAASG